MKLMNRVELKMNDGLSIYDKQVSELAWDRTSKTCSLDTNWARCQRCILAQDCSYKHDPHAVQPMPRK